MYSVIKQNVWRSSTPSWQKEINIIFHMLYRSPDSIQLKWMASQWEVQIEIILGNEWWHVQKRFSEPHEHSNELFSNEIFLQQLYQSNTIAIKCGIFFLFNLIKLLSRLIISSRTLLIITSTINPFWVFWLFLNLQRNLFTIPTTISEDVCILSDAHIEV